MLGGVRGCCRYFENDLQGLPLHPVSKVVAPDYCEVPWIMDYIHENKILQQVDTCAISPSSISLAMRASSPAVTVFVIASSERRESTDSLELPASEIELLLRICGDGRLPSLDVGLGASYAEYRSLLSDKAGDCDIPGDLGMNAVGLVELLESSGVE